MFTRSLLCIWFFFSIKKLKSLTICITSVCVDVDAQEESHCHLWAPLQGGRDGGQEGRASGQAPGARWQKCAQPSRNESHAGESFLWNLIRVRVRSFPALYGQLSCRLLVKYREGFSSDFAMLRNERVVMNFLLSPWSASRLLKHDTCRLLSVHIIWSVRWRSDSLSRLLFISSTTRTRCSSIKTWPLLFKACKLTRCWVKCFSGVVGDL